jgi:membrane protease YdiL (CAAX protease family)
MLERFKRSAFTAPLLVLAICALMLLIGNALSGMHFESKQSLLLTYAAAELFVFVLPGVFYAKCKKRGYVEELQLISFGFAQLPLIALAFFVMVFGSILASLVYGHFGVSFDSSAEIWQDALALSGGDFFSNEQDVIYLSFVLAVVPAFAEEFVFRGILLKEYSRYGVFSAVTVTSLFFAMLHFDTLLFPLYFLSGMVLGFTAYTARSVFASSILHSLYNLFSLFIAPLVSNFISLEQGKIAVFYVAAVLFLLFLMLALGECERLFAGYSISGLSSPKQTKKRFAALPASIEVLSLPFLICIVLFILGVLQIIPFPV